MRHIEPRGASVPVLRPHGSREDSQVAAHSRVIIGMSGEGEADDDQRRDAEGSSL